MSQTLLSTPEIQEMLDATLPNNDLVFGMIGVNPDSCPSATGVINPTTVEALYDLASKLYGAGEYKDADTLFQMLCCYKNDDARFWMGLGGCRQAEGTPQSAMEAYTTAAFLQQFTSPQPLFFSAMCLLRLGLREAAMHMLRILAQMDETNTPADRECHEKGQILLQAIEAELKKAQ